MRCHKDDRKWIKEQINKLPGEYKTMAIEGYEKVYSEVSEQNHGEIAESSLARRAANTRLRLFVDKLTK